MLFFSISSIGTRTLQVNDHVNVFIFPLKILKNVKQNLLRVFHELFKQSPRLKERNLFHAFLISCFKNIFIDYKSPYQIFPGMVKKLENKFLLEIYPSNCDVW